MTDRVQGKFLFESNRHWMHGHSYFVTDGVSRIRFACRFCDILLGERPYHLKGTHCWKCMSKYCHSCWTLHEWYGKCPGDGQTDQKYKEDNPPE